MLACLVFEYNSAAGNHFKAVSPEFFNPNKWHTLSYYTPLYEKDIKKQNKPIETTMQAESNICNACHRHRISLCYLPVCQ